MSDDARPAPRSAAPPAEIPVPTLRPGRGGEVAWRRRRVFVAAEYEDGPLPCGRELKRYREADPNAPGIILDELRNEARHRRRLERELVTAENRRAERGQAFALVVILVGLGISALLIQGGHEWAGAAVGGVNLLGMATLFIALRDPDSRRDAETRPAAR